MEIRLWRELLIPYELAVKELVMKFNHLKKEHQEKDLYSPIEEVTGRVKSINSILEKNTGDYQRAIKTALQRIKWLDS